MAFTAAQKDLVSKWIADAIAPWTTRVEELEVQLQEARADNKQLRRRLDDSEVALDDLENYGRRMNIRIEGIEYDRDETQEDLYEKVKGCLQEVDIAVKKTDIVRFHRSGPPQRKDGKTTAQTIVKFVRWDKRSQAHFANKRARQGHKSFRIHNDLTRRRFALLSRARAQLAEKFPDDRNTDNTFAYTDVNSNLKIRRGREVFDLNTDQDLKNIIRQLSE